MVQLKIYKIIALEVDGVSNIYYLECLWIRSHSQHSVVNKKKKKRIDIEEFKIEGARKAMVRSIFLITISLVLKEAVGSSVGMIIVCNALKLSKIDAKATHYKLNCS